MTLLYTCTSAISVVIWHPQMLGHVLCSEGECLSDAGLVVFAQLIRKLPPLIPLRPGKHKALVSAHTIAVHPMLGIAMSLLRSSILRCSGRSFVLKVCVCLMRVS